MKLASALQQINKNLMTTQQKGYLFGILRLIMGILESQGTEELVPFPIFCVIAALSERIVALDSIVEQCINKLDLNALAAKLSKAKDMFMVNDHDHKVFPCDFH